MLIKKLGKLLWVFEVLDWYIYREHLYDKNFTSSNSKNIIKNDRVPVLSGNKDSCVVIIQREDYDIKLQNIQDGIRQGIFSPTVDTTLRIQQRLAFANVLRCSRLRFWVGFYSKFTPVFF